MLMIAYLKFIIIILIIYELSKPNESYCTLKVLRNMCGTFHAHSTIECRKEMVSKLKKLPKTAI